MDLGAYAQIGDLEQLAKDNGIGIPRLRGYRLMGNEVPLSEKDMRKLYDRAAIDAVQDLCASKPFWDPHSTTCSLCGYTDFLKSKYLIRDSKGEYIGIRWNKIHGWKRKILKFEIKKERRKIQKQYELWNRYAGKKDILYIHSRMGGDNWKYFKHKDKILNAPWFLDRVDDWFDSTYCDFYAKLNTVGQGGKNE